MAIKSNAAKREAGKVSAKNAKEAKPKNHMSAWFEWGDEHNLIYICTSLGFCAPVPTHAALAIVRCGYKIKEPD